MIRQHSREQVMVEACMKQIIEWPSEGSPKFVSGEQALTGTEPVTNQECMFVHEKVDDTSI